MIRFRGGGRTLAAAMAAAAAVAAIAAAGPALATPSAAPSAGTHQIVKPARHPGTVRTPHFADGQRIRIWQDSTTENGIDCGLGTDVVCNLEGVPGFFQLNFEGVVQSNGSPLPSGYGNYAGHNMWQLVNKSGPGCAAYKTTSPNGEHMANRPCSNNPYQYWIFFGEWLVSVEGTIQDNDPPYGNAAHTLQQGQTSFVWTEGTRGIGANQLDQWLEQAA